MIFLQNFIINYPVLVLILTVILVLLSKYYLDKRRIFQLGNKLPGPKGWPFFGNALEFLDCNYDATPKINEYHKSYDLFALWIGHQLSVFVKSPEDAETYCNSYKLIHRGEKVKYFDSFLGKGLLFSGGEEWKKAKRVMLSGLTALLSSKHFIGVIQNETNFMMELLKKEGEKVFLAYPYIRDCLFDVISGGAFELELKAQKNEVEVVKPIELIKHLATKRMFSPWEQPDFLYKFFKDGKLWHQSFDVINRFFRNHFEKKTEFLGKHTCDKDEERMGLFLLWKLMKKENLSMEEVQHHVYTTILTGFETTGNTTVFILSLLGLYPDIQEKTYEELISVINKEEFDGENLQKLEYLERVIKETLRLFPTVPLNCRKCTEDIQFGKYLVPAGSDVHLNIFALHRDPKHFQNPNEFNPDHFLPENVAKRHPFAFIPFSMGPRKCIGMKLAMMSMKIIVGKILMNYKIECDYKNLDEIPFRNEITIKMPNDCPIRLINRQ